MTRNLFISLLIILFAISCDKENVSEIQADSFIKYFSNYPVFTAADVKQVNGSGYAILGTSKTTNSGTELCLLRTDKFGNTIDSARFYGKELDDQAYCLQVTDDGGFAILGSSRNTSTNKLEVYFIRTDSVGDILWERTMGSTGNVEARYFEINDQGSFIMTGYSEKSTTINTTVVTIKQIWIGALDKDGNQPYWSPKIMPSTKDAEGRHLQILDDGNFVITGISKNSPVALEAAFAHAFILKTTSTGGISGIYFLPSSTDEEGNCIRVIDNDHFLVLGTKTGSAGSDISLKYASLSALSVEWEKTYGGAGNDFGCSLLTEGNSIYLLGTTATSGTNTAISLITTDDSGDQTARSDFGLGSKLSGCSFGRTTNNGFIITGTNEFSVDNKSLALIKTGDHATL
jgi:hypothetical protein